ncbi:MAG: hypothetical protein HYZ19_04195 [Rhodocyclales bacterium]|nr:hypothetical protein [Rhodocyclales bacterium]
MLSLQECLDLSGLSEEEIEAIAEHEHVPEIVAAEIGNTLLQTKAGICLIKLYLLENVEHARCLGQFEKAKQLDALYRRFDSEHPGAAPVREELLH